MSIDSIFTFTRGTLIGVVVGSALGIWIAVGTTVNSDDIENAFGLYKVRDYPWCT